jgi:uncharacterized protein Yka (UPF0111/DUF47 family)
MKAQVLAAIGESGISRPAAVNAALAANDRVKYALTLLQMAAAHADQPDQPPASLRRERLACGIDDASLDSFAAAARRQGSAYLLPGTAGLLGHIATDLREMAAPVLEAKTPGFATRLKDLLAGMPKAADDVLDAASLTALTTATPAPGADSLHRLVMDLHHQLNAIQAALAEETIDGAAGYGLSDIDRPRVAAFMAGLNRTARLKFNHPGLGTTATNDGGRLVIQNDIGTTDAHVVVIHVEAAEAVEPVAAAKPPAQAKADDAAKAAAPAKTTPAKAGPAGKAGEHWVVRVTYTDVHPERLKFFQDLLRAASPAWDTVKADRLGGTAFHLATARIDAADETTLRTRLQIVGSRLVFLIDWNRARKQLRAFLPGEARVDLLRWAADQDVGHRAFLELGGARLVNQAIESTAGSGMHFGDRLCDVLGVTETEAFLRFVLRAATDCLTARRSPSLLRDRIGTELARHFSNERRRLLCLSADHAALLFELAALVRDSVLALGEPNQHGAVERARGYEHDADRLVIDARLAVRRRPDHAIFIPLLHAADDAADELEEAVFLLGLLSETGPAALVAEPLQAVAALLVEAAQEWLKALLNAAHAEDRSNVEDADDFLVAIDRVAALEHATDDAERALAAAAVRHAEDFRQLHLYTALGAKLETAADALKHASLMLRDHLLGEMLGG